MRYYFNISSLVVNDAEEAIFYYESRKLGLGDDIKLCLFTGLDDILLNPLHCAKKHKEVRIKYIIRFPYGIHYILKGDEIKIIAFFHVRREPGKWKERLFYEK